MFRSPFTELSVEPAQLQLLQHSRGNAPGDCHRARAVAEPSVMPFLRSPPDRRSCFTTFAHPMLDSGNMLRAQNLRYAAPQSLSAIIVIMSGTAIICWDTIVLERCMVRNQSSLTCSNAFRRHRVAAHGLVS